MVKNMDQNADITVNANVKTHKSYICDSTNKITIGKKKKNQKHKLS